LLGHRLADGRLPSEAVGLGGLQGLEFVVAAEQVADGTLRRRHAVAGQLDVDLGDAADSSLQNRKK
jgi:hypothetical protein